jgi:hypothetical protein
MRFVFKAMTLALMLVAGPASAVSLGLVPRPDPVMTIAAGSADTGTDGSLIANGTISSFVAGGVAQPGSFEFLIDITATDGLLSVYETASPQDTVFGTLLDVGFVAGRIELLFDGEAGLAPGFGGPILVILTSPDFPADPFAAAVTTDTLGGVIATPVPLPGALPLAVAAFAALGGLALRRRAA